jgi:hypothetical protein
MRFSSHGTVASLSIAMWICGLDGTAFSQIGPSDSPSSSLPGVMVEAPKQVSRHQKSRQPAVNVNTVSRGTAPARQTSSAAPGSVTAKLAKLASATGSCVGGCVTSFKYGDAPWHGCSGSAWPALSSTCRNTGAFKTYAECTEAGVLMGWKSSEVAWYCTSLALK